MCVGHAGDPGGDKGGFAVVAVLAVLALVALAFGELGWAIVLGAIAIILLTFFAIARWRNLPYDE